MSENDHRYTAALAGEIERRWQARWEASGVHHADDPAGDLAGPRAQDGSEKLFVMDMFPYPSGKGLHVGHPLGYIATDVVARHQRMLGKNVLYTLGYDAFGLPAEQFAVQTGTHPRTTTEANIETMRAQLHRLGLSHDARRSFATTDPAFVKWTQWIFLQIFSSWFDPDAPGADGTTGRARPIAELIDQFRSGARPVAPSPADPAAAARTRDAFVADPSAFPVWDELTREQQEDVLSTYRLAYLSDTAVNWCPGLGTVLANEEVTAEGRSERGNFPVFRSTLRQWNMRITAYADRLIDDLDRVDWPESVKIMQRNWIGRSHGATVAFPITGAGTGTGTGTTKTDTGTTDTVPGTGADTATDASFDVFTTRVDTLFGATFCVLSPEHPLLAGEASATDPAQAPVALPAQWPADTPASWTGGHATPREAVRAYQAAAAAMGEEERTADDVRTKTGVFTGLVATNPMDERELPVFTADYVLMGYGTGAIMAVPGEDERDFAFATAYDLPVIRTVRPPEDFDGGAWTGAGEKINSAHGDLDLNGMNTDEAKQAALEYAQRQGFGYPTTTYRLRDWLFSRQRYWGEPFPIVYDVEHPDTPIALPTELLPVDLPEVEDFSPRTFDPEDRDTEPQTPLSRNAQWATVELDLGDGKRTYRRETNTMPNWAGSSWYEIRYTDPTNEHELASAENERYWMGPRADGGVGGVDLYVGGVEHAVLHLLYARFWHKVLFDLGHVSSQEPFHRLFNQGYVQAYAYTDARGVYVPAHEVTEEPDGTFTHRGEPVTQEYGKMGKSLKNMVTPDEIFAGYGADTFRVYEMSMGPLDLSRPWETRAVVGAQRFLQRLWRLVVDEESGDLVVTDDAPDLVLLRELHRTIDGVRGDMEHLRFNTVVAKLIELVNTLTKTGSSPRAIIEPLVLMVAPLAPHVAEELWHRLGHEDSVVRASYPEVDPQYLVQDTVTCVVQVKGKVRHRVEVSPDIAANDLEALVLAEDRVQELLAGASVRKVIVRAPKLVNVVV